MINKLKTFATTILVTGATVIATNAPADPSTNMQVVDNVNVTLKIYSQGALKTPAHGNDTLPATTQQFTTADLLSELGNVIPGYTYKRGDKLVLNTFYGNTLVTNATPLVYAISNANIGSAAATDVATPATTVTGQIGSQDLSAVTIGTNVVTITNTGTAVQLSYGSPATTVDIVTNLLTVSSNVAGTPTVFAQTNFDTNVGYLTTITPQTNGGTVAPGSTPAADVEIITNYIVKTTSGTVETVFTNTAEPALGILTAANTSSTGATVISATNWLKIANNGPTIYQETGSDLSTSNFVGTNINSQTAYNGGTSLTVNAFGVTGTNNLVFTVRGFDQAALKVLNLAVGGNAHTVKQVFDVSGNATADVAGYGNAGGDFTTNGTAVSALTNTIFSASTGVSGNFVNADGITNGNYGSTNGYLTNTTPIVLKGTVTTSFLKAYPQ